MELGILPNSGLTIPQLPLDIRASYFDRTPIPAPIPSTAKLSAAQGKAALYGSIADTLAKLPETLMGAYQAGKKMATGNATTNAYNAALAGNPVAGTTLADFKATGAGDVTLNPEDPTAHLLKIEALKKQTAPTLYDTIDAGLGRSGLPSIPAKPASAPMATPDATDTENLDYLDGYGGVQNNEPRLLDQNGLPKDATDAERSGLLLPPDGFKAAPKPNFRGTAAPVPLGQLSDFQQVAPQDRNAIEGAAMNIGKQLTAVPESSLGASTDASAPVAAIQPVSQEQALATFADSQPQGFSQQETTDPSPAQTVITKDPITKIITATTPDGRTLQIGPKENAWKEVKAEKQAKPGFDSPEELQQFAQAHGMIPGNPKQGTDGKWYSDNSTFAPKLDRETAKRLAEANATGAGIAVAGKTPDEVAAALAAWQKGQLTDAQINHVTHLRDRYASLPIYHAAQNVIDGYHNAQLAAKNESGISDKTLIEEGQRVLNPQNGVRVQTIQMFGGSSGLMERLSPSYIAAHLTKGTILTPAQRKEYLGILDKAYKERVADMDEAAQQHIKMADKARVPADFAQDYFDNPYKVSQDRQAAASTVAPQDAAALQYIRDNANDPTKAAQVAKTKAALQARGIPIQ